MTWTSRHNATIPPGLIGAMGGIRVDGFNFTRPKPSTHTQLKPGRTPSMAGFKAFVHAANPRFKWYAHCERLAAVLIRVAAGELKRVMVFLPPRHSKSETVSRLFTAYYLSLFPDRFVGLNCYAQELANTLSRAARQNYISNGGEVRDDAAAVKQWETNEGGGLWAAGVGGPITGKGFHLGIIDDPVKNAKDAASDVVQNAHQEWYASTFYTRAEPDAAIILIQTRWNENDQAGYLLSQETEEDEPERWHIVNFPAIKETLPDDDKKPQFPATCTVEPDPREEGEALCPERYNLKKLAKIASKIGSYFWNALFQQRPTAREGNMFKLSDLPIVGAFPVGEGVKRIRYWDLGGSDSNKADYSVGVRMSVKDGVFYVEDVKRGQWSPRERNEQIRTTAENDNQEFGSMTTWIEKVPGLAVEVIANIVKVLAGLPVQTEMAKNDKVTRADPLSSQCEAGNVKVVEARWNKAYRDEMTEFPNSKNDDQVDASSGAFSKLAAKREWKVF